jgi:hypothetical protein
MAERNLSIRLSVIDGGKVKAELSEIGEKGGQRNFLSVNPRRAIWLGKGDHACKLR